MNKVILGGRLTRDPQLETVGDKDRVRFTLAVMREYKTKLPASMTLISRI